MEPYASVCEIREYLFQEFICYFQLW